MKNLKRKKHFVFFAAISLFLFFFYLFFVNLSTDTVSIFLAQKIFLGKWLLKGIFPWFNPHFFAGVPFAFDLGLGNFHPFNLFFLFAYPLSFASWVAFSSFLFLIGFYLMFEKISKNKNLSIILTLIFFFSGSGFQRLNNPTIFLPIAHYGLFIYSLDRLKEKEGKSYLFPLLSGILMTLAGHIQFVIYGYILGLICLIFIYKIPFRKVIAYYSLLVIFVAWYYLFSLPLSLSSTRITSSSSYMNLDNLKIIQLIQLFFPFFFGEVRTGASWNAGPFPGLPISIFCISILAFLLIKRKNKLFFVLLFIALVSALGFLKLPFLRGARQIIVIFHVLALITIANSPKALDGFVDFLKSRKKILFGLVLINLAAVIFFYSGYFYDFFLLIYRLVKHATPGLFFDKETVRAISGLIGKSLLIWLIFLAAVTFFAKRKSFMLALTFFILFEGMLFNYSANYFIPAKIITATSPIPSNINAAAYRTQSISEVMPFSGYFNYVNDFYFRPPFSKEKPVFDREESRTYAKLKQAFSIIPSSWGMVLGVKGIQGYNTFVPAKITAFFKKPSPDFEKEYEEIIKRNPLFKTAALTSLNINILEMRDITLYDPRWEELGVRYFISDRKLKKYDLVSEEGGRYIYENRNSPPIYSMEPVYQDPNGYIFNIKEEDLGKTLELIINPDGFVIEYNGKKIEPKRGDFKITVDLKEIGILKIFYSPLFHLKQYFSLALR